MPKAKITPKTEVERAAMTLQKDEYIVMVPVVQLVPMRVRAENSLHAASLAMEGEGEELKLSDTEEPYINADHNVVKVYHAGGGTSREEWEDFDE